MSRINDVGGMQGFGPLRRDADEPAFHPDWEAHGFALNRALVGRGVYNLDEFRDAIERIPPQEYLASAYYGLLFRAITTLLAEKGVLTAAEIAGGWAVRSRSPGADRPGRPPAPPPAAAVCSRRRRDGHRMSGPPPAARSPGQAAAGRARAGLRGPVRGPGPVRRRRPYRDPRSLAELPASGWDPGAAVSGDHEGPAATLAAQVRHLEALLEQRGLVDSREL